MLEDSDICRAIDRLLLCLEVVGSAEDQKTLQSLDKQWIDRLEEDKTPEPEWSTKHRVQQTVLQHHDWALAVMNSRVED